MDNRILSDDLNTAAPAIQTFVAQDKGSAYKRQAQVGQDYYDYKHDILDNRIFYVDDHGQLQEDKYATNVKIPHPFFTELVEQKTQYLLSNPVALNTENEKLKERLSDYIDNDFQVALQDVIQGASIKGAEFIYARTTTQDKLKFEAADSLQTRAVYNDDNETVAIIRYYNRDIVKGNKTVTITYVERWTDQDVAFFAMDEKGKIYIDESQAINPRPHVIAIAEDGSTLGRTYGTIPFYKLTNNSNETSDLAPIKAIIDDYDLMNAFLSNNLQDFTEAIYVVKGYKGDSLETLRQNIKAKKTVALPTDGGVDVKTFDIPVEARKLKLDLDRENIYKFGMGFDSAQVGDGNITNIVIKSRYSLLDLKCNKAEARLRAMLSWVIKMVLADIQRRYNETYAPNELEIEITRDTMVNEMDNANIALIEAQTKATIIQAILAAAPQIGDESTLKLICEQFDLDFEEVQKQIEEQDYTAGIATGTDPEDDDEASLDKAVSSVSKTLNGAQITSMLSVIEQVKNGILSADQGIAILTGSLGIDLAQANKVIGVAQEVAASGPTN